MPSTEWNNSSFLFRECVYFVDKAVGRDTESTHVPKATIMLTVPLHNIIMVCMHVG